MNKYNLARCILFTVVLAYIPMWTQTNLLLESLGKGKPPITFVDNPELRQLVKDKTSVDIGTIKISESDRPFGMMVGVPGSPQLLLSRGLYDSFTPDEMEYVVLHEAGHYVLNHNIKELGLGVLLLILGMLVLKRVKNFSRAIAFAVMLGLVFGVGVVQLGKLSELQADNYSVTRMTSPEGMITATQKFRDYYGKSFTQTDNNIFQWMFYRGNPYDNRINMAKAEISHRAK